MERLGCSYGSLSLSLQAVGSDNRHMSMTTRAAKLTDPRVCSIAAAFTVVGEKWSLLVVREITFGQIRFDDIAYNTGAPRDVLSTRLKSLEAAGIIQRRQYQNRPVRFEYYLSEAGEQLIPILYAISDWGDRYARADPENLVRFHHSCGAKLNVKIQCASCGEQISSLNVKGDREIRLSDLVTLVPKT